VIDVVFKALSANDEWLKSDVKKVAATLSGYTGLEAETYEAMLSRNPSYSVSYLQPGVEAQQQQVADAFYSLGLIPKAIKVKDAFWKP
jgi:sulfonate transport system substrate-binding protein